MMAKNAKPKVKCPACGRITKKAYALDGRCKTCFQNTRYAGLVPPIARH